MSGAPDSPVRGGWLGILGSWLQTRSSEIRPLPEDRSSGTTGPDAHPGALLRVLVVDDNPVNLMVMSELLASRGLLPLQAADGAEAVALACEMQFDLILMDLQMPILDGLGATSAIRRFESSASRPVVPVIAYSSASPGARVLARHGLNGSLTKPCGDQELEACLIRWCPAYRSGSTSRGVAHDHSPWQAANRASGSSAAWPR